MMDLNGVIGDKVFVYLTVADEDQEVRQYGAELLLYGGNHYSYKITDDGIAESPVPWKSKPIEQLREERQEQKT